VFIKNLPDNIKDIDLEKEFSKYGKVLSARVMLDLST